MEQYISKSAVAAEIKRRLSLLENGTGDSEVMKRVEGVIKGYKSILSFLNTLEVKEVDLKKELDYDDYINFFTEHPDYSNGDWGFDECWVFAKHFFELGLKAQKEE